MFDEYERVGSRNLSNYDVWKLEIDNKKLKMIFGDPADKDIPST